MRSAATMPFPMPTLKKQQQSDYSSIRPNFSFRGLLLPVGRCRGSALKAAHGGTLTRTRDGPDSRRTECCQ